MTTSVAAAAAIQSRFDTLVQTPESLIVEYDNVAPVDSDGNSAAQPENATWCRATINEGESKHISLGQSGAKSSRIPGVFTVQIFSPIETGEAAARALIDIIKTNFRLVNASGITWKEPSSRKIGRSGAWWQVNVNCPFHYEN